MGVHFNPTHSRLERQRMLRVVIPTTATPVCIVIGHNRSFWRTVAMHHCPLLQREVPCRTEDCTMCPQPTREITYIPCLLAHGASPAGKFWPRIVPVTDGFSEILEGDHEKNVYKISRLARNQACRWHVMSSLSTFGLTPYPGQDIEASLFRMWGIKG